MTQRFSAQVDEWVAKVERRAEAVLRQSAQDLFALAQTPKAQGGRLPVDTGNLRNSFVSALNGSTALTGANAYELSIAQMRLGDVLFGGWTAAYARRIEYGFVGTDSRGRTYNQPAQRFAGAAAEQWQQIVSDNVARLRSMG